MFHCSKLEPYRMQQLALLKAICQPSVPLTVETLDDESLTLSRLHLEDYRVHTLESKDVVDKLYDRFPNLTFTPIEEFDVFVLTQDHFILIVSMSSISLLALESTLGDEVDEIFDEFNYSTMEWLLAGLPTVTDLIPDVPVHTVMDPDCFVGVVSYDPRQKILHATNGSVAGMYIDIDSDLDAVLTTLTAHAEQNLKEEHHLLKVSGRVDATFKVYSGDRYTLYHSVKNPIYAELKPYPPVIVMPNAGHPKFDRLP